MKNKPSLEEGDWDFANVQEHAPVRSPRAVVSVSFNSDDLKVVADWAEALGLKTSEYIRKAALGEIDSKPRAGVTTIRSSGSGTAPGFESPTSTVAYGRSLDRPANYSSTSTPSLSPTEKRNVPTG